MSNKLNSYSNSRTKIRKIIIISSTLILLFLFCNVSLEVYRVARTLNTEQNGLDIVKAVFEEKMTGKKVIRVNNSMMIIKKEYMDNYLLSKGWKQADRMGAQITYKDNKNQKFVVMCTLVYSSDYMKWVWDDKKYHIE